MENKTKRSTKKGKIPKIEINCKVLYEIFFNNNEEADYKQFVQEKQRQIKEKERKDKMKTEEVIQKERQIIHDISYNLFHKNFLFTSCKQPAIVGEKQISQGKTYEILSVDFRQDENYILIRDYNKNTKPLFDGITRNVNNRRIKCSNYFEFLRRGYYDCNEDFMIELKKINEKRVVKELIKGVIEIPVYLFINNFNEITKINSKDQLQKRKESFDISSKYNCIEITY